MMYISLDSLREFHWGGLKFTLPSDIIRYMEFEEVVVFFLNNEGRKNLVVGVKFTLKPYSHFYIAWEFICGDWNKYKDQVNVIVKENYKNDIESIKITSTSGMVYWLNPLTGEVIDKMDTKR